VSLLAITKEMVTPRGREIPDGDYRGTVEAVSHEQSGNGWTLKRQYGNIRTASGQTEFTLPDGTVFRVGRRKLFARSWTSHANGKAQEIGHEEIAQEAISAGLAQAPTDGNNTELNYPSWEQYAEALAGREVFFRVRNVPKTRNGEVQKNPDGTPQMEAVISAYLPQ